MKIKNFVEKSLVSSLYSSNLLFSNLLEKNLKKTELNYLEAVILTAIFFENEKDQIGPTRLSNVLGIRKARVSKALTSLTHFGFIKRELVKSDSRKIKIRIEPQGEKKASQIIKIFDSLESQIESQFSLGKAATLQKDLARLSIILKALKAV